MTFEKTNLKEVDAITHIVADARSRIGRLGIDQWQNGYPARSDIEADIERGESWCVEQAGSVVGTFALILGGEPTYDLIEDGAWLTDSDSKEAKYAAIHRITIKRAKRGSGISTAIVKFALDLARVNGKESVRVDTHYGNVIMRRMLEKHGFHECGRTYLASGDPRVGYEQRV